MDNRKKFALSIPAAFAFAVSVISYFLPFFKIRGADFLGPFGEVLEWSMLQFVQGAFELPMMGDDMAIVLILLLVFLVAVPALLALIGAFVTVILKPKTGGIIATVAGGYGLIALLMWNVIFAQEIDTGLLGSFALNDFIEFNFGAIINGIAYVISLALGIAMICMFNKSDNNSMYAGNFGQGNMQPDYDYDAQNYNGYDYNNQNYNAYSDNNYGGQNQNELIGEYVDIYSDSNAESVTSRREQNEFSDEEVTVMLTPDIDTPHVATEQKKTGKIICTSGKFKGAEFPIADGETICIGRDPKQCNIVIDKECVYVGRMHCCITYNAANNRYQVYVGSQNGVVLSNKTRIGANQKVVLFAGSSIELGNSENSFELN